MHVSVKLPTEFQGIFQNLFKQDPMEGTIRLVLNELRKKLTEYTLMDKIFKERYKMDFEEFKRKQIVEDSGYSFNVEEDFCDWELAIDGIKSITTNYVLIGWNNRLYGRDCIGGRWHRHPFHDPDLHDTTDDGAKKVTPEEFLDEVFEILLKEKIL